MPGNHPDSTVIFIIDQSSVSTNREEVSKSAVAAGRRKCVCGEETEARLPARKAVRIRDCKRSGNDEVLFIGLNFCTEEQEAVLGIPEFADFRAKHEVRARGKHRTVRDAFFPFRGEQDGYPVDLHHALCIRDSRQNPFHGNTPLLYEITD